VTPPREKFQELLRELFQFDCADLDFGIYRIMNYKRDAIEAFISEELAETVGRELDNGIIARQTQLAEALSKKKEDILEKLGPQALDPEGNLLDFHASKIGMEYLELREKAAGAMSREAVEAAIFNHLYAFFGRYYQDGDFISQRRYSRREKYCIPYNGEEVHLHWANRDQYYVKTGEHFHDYRYKDAYGTSVHFKLAAADVEQNNVKGDKRFFLPRIPDMEWNEEARELTIPFEYRPLTDAETETYGKKNQQEKIIETTVEAVPRELKPGSPASLAATAEKRKDADGRTVTLLEHHLRRYTRKNSSDFFIHKDLKGFLNRELDFYLKNEALNVDDLLGGGEFRAEGWFQVVKTMKDVGARIIDFLDQIESFQKMLWEKRKFVTETQYCITVGNIGENFYPEIAACDAQWAEWEDLFHIDEEQEDLFSNGKSGAERRVAMLRENPTLVLDTKHFDPEFTDRLLGAIKDIEKTCDGLLIHSDNFQALQLLAEKFHKKARCVYIDPPYNTDASPILYRNGYKSSSWMALMENRFRAVYPLLTGDGVLVAAIDDEQQRELSHLLSQTFQNRLLGTICVRSNPSGRPMKTGYSVSHEYLLFAGKSEDSYIRRLPPTQKQLSRFSESDEKGPFEWRNLRREGSNSDRKARRALYYPIYIDGKSLRVPKMEWNEAREEWIILESPKGKEKAVWPDNENGDPKTWRWEWPTVLDSADRLAVRPDRSGRPYVYYKRRPHEEGVVSVSCWFDPKYSATEHGTAVIKSLFGHCSFSYPKSIHAVMDSLYVGGAYAKDSLVIDYFAGSGTTLHALINLNRMDGGFRTGVAVEVENYFDSVLLPRIKKVTFSPEWKNGKPKRTATPEEAARSPRIVKYIRLESYEDALNNIQMDDTGAQAAIQFDDYLLQYMLRWESRKSETLLNIQKLTRPFDYRLTIANGGGTAQKPVDLPETFNYLLGLHVQTRKVHFDEDRRYLVFRGKIGRRSAAVIWRDTEGWEKADLERDKAFVAEQKLTEGADEAFVNGDSFIQEAKALEPVFKARMFAPVEG
jgi:adenine-specific DNA-methyltransferase